MKRRTLAAIAALFLGGTAYAEINTVITFPGGSNGSVQTNRRGVFYGDNQFTYSTGTYTLNVPIVNVSTIAINGQTYFFPTSTCPGGTFFRLDGSNTVTCETPTTFAVSTGTTIGIYDGGVNISTITSDLDFNGSQFIVSLQGNTTALIQLNPSSVTVMGVLTAASPVVLTGSQFSLDKSSVTLRGPDPTLGGDLTGTISNAAVTDDSHSHTHLTISNLDISGDTNLAVSAPITLSGDTVGIDKDSATLSGRQINLDTSEVTGVLPSAHMVSTAAFTTSSGTWSATQTFVSSQTFVSTMTLSGERRVKNIAPSDGNILKWVAADNNWAPAEESGGTGTGNSAITFTSVSSFTLTHNIGTESIVWDCYDGSDNSIDVSTFTIIDANTAAVYFVSAQTGKCVVNGSGGAIGGGGGSSMAVFRDGVKITSPTPVQKFIGTDFDVVLTGDATAQVSISTNIARLGTNQTWTAPQAWTSSGTFTNLLAGTTIQSFQVNTTSAAVTYLRYADGTVSTTAVVSAGGGSGDITSVTAGYGLDGGGTSGALTVDLSSNTTSYIHNNDSLQVGATAYTWQLAAHDNIQVVDGNIQGTNSSNGTAIFQAFPESVGEETITGYTVNDSGASGATTSIGYSANITDASTNNWAFYAAGGDTRLLNTYIHNGAQLRFYVPPAAQFPYVAFKTSTTLVDNANQIYVHPRSTGTVDQVMAIQSVDDEVHLYWKDDATGGGGGGGYNVEPATVTFILPLGATIQALVVQSSIAVNGSGDGEIVFTRSGVDYAVISSSLTGIAGRCVNWSGDGTLGVANAECGEGSGGSGTANDSTSFTSVSSFTLTHSLSTIDVVYTCYDASDNAIIPSTFTVLGISSAAVHFASAQTGRCVMNGSGGTSSGGGGGDHLINLSTGTFGTLPYQVSLSTASMGTLPYQISFASQTMQNLWRISLSTGTMGVLPYQVALATGVTGVLPYGVSLSTGVTGTLAHRVSLSTGTMGVLPYQISLSTGVVGTVVGDSLGNHVATQTITAGLGINASTITVSTITVTDRLEVTGSNAGAAILTQGTAPSGEASKQVIYAASDGWTKLIPNNGQTYFVAASSTTSKAGKCAQWTGEGSLIAAADACGTGGGSGDAVLAATQTWTGGNELYGNTTFYGEVFYANKSTFSFVDAVVEVDTITVADAIFVGGQEVCLEDGTNCPPGGGGSDHLINLSTGTFGVLPYNVSLSTGVMGTLAHRVSLSTGTVGVLPYQVSLTTAVMGTLPHQVSLSSQVVGSLPAASVAAGTLGSSVIASSVAAGAVGGGQATNNFRTTALAVAFSSGGVLAIDTTRYITVPYSGTITEWTLVSRSTGSLVLDVKKCAGFNCNPTTSIAGTEKPTMSSVWANQDASLSTWTTAIAAGDKIGVNIDSAATITNATLILTIRKD